MAIGWWIQTGNKWKEENVIANVAGHEPREERIRARSLSGQVLTSGECGEKLLGLFFTKGELAST